MDTSELRRLADCDARAGEPLGKALRQAADELDRLKAHSEAWVQEFIDHACQMERQRDEARAELDHYKTFHEVNTAHISKLDHRLARAIEVLRGLDCRQPDCGDAVCQRARDALKELESAAEACAPTTTSAPESNP
jgi:hypothetical protein